MFDDEHHGSAHAELGAELTLRAHWVGLGLIAAIGAGGNVEWSHDALVALGLLGPILMFAIKRSTEGSLGPSLGRFFGWMIPCWVAWGALLAGLAFPAFALLGEEGRQVWQMLPLPAAWMPVSALPLPALIEVVLVFGLYTSALNALLIPQGRLVHARTWAILIFAAGLLALVGLVQRATQAAGILWLVPIGNLQFFATFPHPAQWSAFALLWMSAAFGLLAWLAHQRSWRWLSGDGWLILLVALLLGASVMVAGEPLERLLAVVVAAIGSLVIAWQSRPEPAKGSGLGTASIIWVAATIVMAASAALIFFHYRSGSWVRYDGDRPGFPMHEHVLEDTRNMWRARPWFGWGHASFAVVYGFFQQSDQGTNYWAYARSDLWQSLAENGIIGTVIWWLPPLWIAVRLLRARRLASFLIAPAAGLVAIAALAVVDFPFASPAVFFGFWLVLFSLARWSEVDKESTKSTLSENRRVKRERAAGKTLIQPTPANSPSP